MTGMRGQLKKVLEMPVLIERPQVDKDEHEQQGHISCGCFDKGHAVEIFLKMAHIYLLIQK